MNSQNLVGSSSHSLLSKQQHFNSGVIGRNSKHTAVVQYILTAHTTRFGGGENKGKPKMFFENSGQHR